MIEFGGLLIPACCVCGVFCGIFWGGSFCVCSVGVGVDTIGVGVDTIGGSIMLS